MDRIYNILNQITDAVKKTYEEQKEKLSTKSYYDVNTDDMIEDDEYDTDVTELYTEMLGKKMELDALKKVLTKLKKSRGQDFTQVEKMEEETIEQELMEYKNDFFEMSLGSIKAIATHAQHILDSLDEPSVKENLTESWLQGKIAITEDYMRTIHDFVMFVFENDDDSDAGSKPGLWDNIRKKKDRMGKNYKPAKKGDKDRPDPNQWKKLTKDNKK